MERSQPSLPGSLLVQILSFLALETRPRKYSKRDPSFSNARLAFKALRQAADNVPQSCLGAKLAITSEKLLQARAAGLEDEFLSFVVRMARLWERVELSLHPVDSLRLVLNTLGSSGGSPGSSGSLQRVRLHFADDGGGWWTLPEEVGKLTKLAALKVIHKDDHKPVPRAALLVRLSSLTALQSLRVVAPIVGPLPPAALSSLQQLTSLRMFFWNPRGSFNAPQLGWEHLAALTALRRLDLDGFGLSLSGQQVTAAWQHLEELSLSSTSLDDAGFWGTLCRLPHLSYLASNSVDGQPSAALQRSLAAFPRLAKLWLAGYSEPALPNLPTSLSLYSSTLRVAPISRALCSTCLNHSSALQDWPLELSAMTGLTELTLDSCHLSELPAPVAALPALESLSLSHNKLKDLPQDLACVGCLRTLLLNENLLQRVPSVWMGGAASRLESLNMRSTKVHQWVLDDESALRASLPAVQDLRLPDTACPWR